MVGFRLYFDHFERIKNVKGKLTSELCNIAFSLYLMAHFSVILFIGIRGPEFGLTH